MPKEYIDPPSVVYPDLFKKVHELRLFSDAKAMSDVIPKASSNEINAAYKALEKKDEENVKALVYQYFEVSKTAESTFKTNPENSIEEHIKSLWTVLKREQGPIPEGSSLLPLPHPYVVPGGRFNEIYYWDSFFTMLGLREHGEVDLIESMINNFAFQIDEYGHIPNGCRSYFLSRSQPPFFSSMVELLADIKGDEIYLNYLPQLEKEYTFWMKGKEELSDSQNALNRVVLLEDGTVLNRYYDNLDTPRDEMYPDDIELSEKSEQNPAVLYRHLRAACESGWDFSSRWLADPYDLWTIKAADIIPVDLNCLLFHLEKTLSIAFELKGDWDIAFEFVELAKVRMEAINELFWNEKKGFFYDYNFVKGQHCNVESAAGVYPMYFKITSKDKAEKTNELFQKELLTSGGVRSTNLKTGQQWDAPNGWAPQQFTSLVAMKNYGFNEVAKEIASRWCSLNESVFQSTGKMLEKYNVEDTSLLAGGGEYPVQDGFGWSNGVYLALKKDSDLELE